MVDELLGNIVIQGDAVRFSDRVGHYVTPEQVAVLHRTAAALGKYAVDDRYPTDPNMARGIEFLYSIRSSLDSDKRNEHGVPECTIMSSILTQARQVGLITDD